MGKQLIRVSLICTVAVGLAAREASAQTTIAHWSFDTATITTGPNGILTAADDTAVHNATSVFNGAGVMINSVAGQFGQGAQFTNTIGNQPTNNAYMNFPSLTEIAGPTAGDFTFAAWANIPTGTSTADDNTIIADWGNAAAGTHRFTYWFELDNVDGSTAARPRAQIRAANAPPDPATIDIIATALTAAQAGGTTTFVDSVWHHYVWSWDKTAGTMTFFIDGIQRHVQTTTQTNKDLLISDSAVQQLGGKRDNNRYFSGNMDEVWVFNDDLTPEQVSTLMITNSLNDTVSLRLQVDPVDGDVQLKNTTANPITMNSYRITSATAALNSAGWNPVSNGNEHQAQFPLGDGSGNGWEVAQNPSNGELVEWYLTGNSTLDPGESLYLGMAFNPAGAQNVIMKYTLADLTVRTGVIEYVPVSAPAGVPGDYNNNGTVDAADYVLWRKGGPLQNEGDTPGVVNAADYDFWRSRFGATSGSGSGSAVGSAVVPEPPTVGLLLIAALVSIVARRKS